MVISATLTALAPGVQITRTACSAAASKSTLEVGFEPPLAITRSCGEASITRLVIWSRE